MIADILKYEIESHARRSHDRNPLLREARAGRATAKSVASYLASLRRMVGASPHCLSRASARAQALGKDTLAGYFADKEAEETGHEQWAIDDIAVLERHTGQIATPVPAIEQLLTMLRTRIEDDPELYVAYALWAEYFTVLIGGRFARYLVERCNVPNDALTCLTHHVELDADHAEASLDRIDELIGDPAQVVPMRHLLRRVSELFDLACTQMVEAGRKGMADDNRVAV